MELQSSPKSTFSMRTFTVNQSSAERFEQNKEHTAINADGVHHKKHHIKYAKSGSQSSI